MLLHPSGLKCSLLASVYVPALIFQDDTPAVCDKKTFTPFFSSSVFSYRRGLHTKSSLSISPYHSKIFWLSWAAPLLSSQHLNQHLNVLMISMKRFLTGDSCDSSVCKPASYDKSWEKSKKKISGRSGLRMSRATLTCRGSRWMSAMTWQKGLTRLWRETDLIKWPASSERWNLRVFQEERYFDLYRNVKWPFSTF